ncbi:MAG TPA: transglycosylase domain-containing protein, partial [bacterium]|nr:transglycosylase domain-containing protein [bacterium]
MAKKEKIEKTDLITHILIGIIELLVIIGYVFLWPIERSICFIAKIFNSIKKTSLKTAKNFISIPKTLTKPLFLIFSVFGRVRRTITRIVVFSFRADLLGPARSELSRYRSIFVKASFSRIVGKILFTKHKSKRSSKTNKPTQAAKTKKEPAGSKNIPLDKSLKKKSVKVSHPKRTALRKFLLSPFATFFYGGLFVLLFIVAPAMTYLWYKQLPQPVLLEQRAYNSSTRILDRKGRLLYEIYVDKNYAPVRLEDIPQVVIDSTLAIEDSEFYSHHGFRVTSIVRAAKATLLEDDLQGASTITQQLVKNVLLTPERTISRKVKELVLSILVEQKYSKNEILEFYLNNIPYGGTAYGVQAAANKYFGKDVSDLDLAEASLLAGLPSAPSVYSPVSGNYDLAKERQKQVLDRMVELGFIRSADAEVAYAQELVFASQQEYIRAPHFVEFVRKSLYEIFGQRMVDFGGLSVTTTLDLDLQDQVQEIVREEVDAGARFGFSNAAAVVVDVRTGGILAHVGSYDYFLGSDGKFDVATAYRQPGSSVKPITYALALENGMTAASTVVDAPITYQSYGQKYSPKNYDNTYHGVVTLRTALANSYNIPAVKLVSQLGRDNMVQLGHDIGLSNWKVDNTYG